MLSSSTLARQYHLARTERLGLPLAAASMFSEEMWNAFAPGVAARCLGLDSGDGAGPVKRHRPIGLSVTFWTIQK